jgi:uncharacterized protein
MTERSELKNLLIGLQPQLNSGEYVFCQVRPHDIPAGVEPLMRFHEHEGLTVLLRRGQADELGLRYSLVCAWITLMVNSALESVGLTAAVSAALAEAGIACNVVAAFHHDHLFVPAEQADQAIKILHSLSEKA